MSERLYPPTEEDLRKRRILTPQPSRVPYSPSVDFFEPSPGPTPTLTKPPGCVFIKPCQLPDGITHYFNPAGYVPLELIKEYGHLSLLGGREVDGRGAVALRKIGGSALPAGLGQLALRSAVWESAATAVGSVAGGLLTGLVALAWPSGLGDSALYSEEQLRSMQRARSQMRLHIEQREDGTLKGYGFYTGNHADWQMIDVVQFQSRGDQFVADLDEGVELIWTPAVDPSDTLGIPALEAAPQAPVIWIYPPTEKAAQILVNPIYPPEYRDFILVFPVESGVRPLYVVVNEPRKGLKNPDLGYHPAPRTEDITGFPGLIEQKRKTRKRNGGGLRERWKDAKGKKLFEWDSEQGELEVYRYSDVKHLGSFDPYTGERRGPAKDERRIDK
ncbi:S-type pyocin domain-containing protein [Pseudomonas sp. MAFF 311095]|uniref:S-type pyocin domain-containing protein n=1 Tax=Pseudomonas petroselini TaxID=2899822 RepID=A0ABS8QX13_9PSED|nr:S-type pyocin domain-containing protein [Pseudomonas petroselini]MCD7039724.1 S-type pyocin domain-containing protein [Pseudomonas petroselini]MCD7046883.1 S-type pyocin domain-containing protein [Pseudomonas petroselini]MCD7070061.1 S-type pyocin domain-containing protein [Pseudomonas petroselini]MCD7078683.1 S-type pyocin domain-containing protein [Pseudomonas petroselini]